MFNLVGMQYCRADCWEFNICILVQSHVVPRLLERPEWITIMVKASPCGQIVLHVVPLLIDIDDFVIHQVTYAID